MLRRLATLISISVLLLGLGACSTSRSVDLSDPGESGLPDVSVGDAVTVHTSDGERISGRIASITATELVLVRSQYRDDVEIVVAMEIITAMELKKPTALVWIVPVVVGAALAYLAALMTMWPDTSS